MDTFGEGVCVADESDAPTSMDNNDGESDMVQTLSDPSPDDLECVSAGTSSKDSTGEHTPKDKRDNKRQEMRKGREFRENYGGNC